MLGNLTQAQMEETRTAYTKYYARFQEGLKSGLLDPATSNAFIPPSENIEDYIVKHEDGVYEYVNWYAEKRNFSWEGEEYTFRNDLRDFMQKAFDDMDHGRQDEDDEVPAIASDYGTCDSFDQVWEAYPDLLTDPRTFILRVCKVHKDKQSPQGGWRWWKNGVYLGNKSEGYEYLYDEPNIDFIWKFHIVQLKTN